MISLSQLVTQTAADIGDPSHATFSAEDLRQWLVDAIADYSQHFFRTLIHTIITRNEEQYYGLPDNLHAVIAVELDGTFLPESQFPPADHATRSQQYAVIAHTLYLTSPPAANQTVTITYHAPHTPPPSLPQWSTVFTPADVEDSNQDGITAVAYHNGTWLAGSHSQTGTMQVYRSTNGTDWTKITGANELVSHIATGLDTDGDNVWLMCGRARPGSGVSGSVERSTDNGLTWTNVVAGVNAIHGMATNKDDDWIIVLSDQLRRSTNNGSTFAAYSPPSVPDADDDLTAVACDLNGIWIVTNGRGGIYRSTDDADTYAAETAVADEAITAIASDTNGSWLIGTIDGRIYASTNSGVAWGLTATLPSPISSLYSNRAGLWLAGVKDGRIYASTNNGTTWYIILRVPASLTPVTALTHAGNRYYAATGSLTPSIISSNAEQFITVPDIHLPILRAYAKWQSLAQLKAKEETSPTSNSSLLMSQLGVNVNILRRAYIDMLAKAIQAQPTPYGFVSWDDNSPETRRIY